ncbi:MAG: hypothetical protein KDB08_10610, partial [Microthrixaceae bacterium]|nr:hypothetical protein [Microthrixaceae bacterium]
AAMGAGYQHFALRCADIFAIAEHIDQDVILQAPPSYYEILALRFDLDAAMIDRLRRCNLLYDEDANGRYLQLYTVEVNGLFLELVQREGYQGFGAVNAPVRMAAQTRDHEATQAFISSLETD